MGRISLIERIARLIGPTERRPWEDLWEGEQARALAKAEEIIVTIRDPSPGMIDAGSKAAATVPIPSTVETAWKAMCDEAIAEHHRPPEPPEARSTENLIRNIIRGMDQKGAIGVSLDRAALEGMLDLSTAQINVEFIGGKNV